MYVLSLFKKDWRKVVYFICYKCNTTNPIAISRNLSLLGCASPRLHLAVNDSFSDEVDTVLEINALMLKLRTLLLAAKLQNFTPLLARTKKYTLKLRIFSL